MGRQDRVIDHLVEQQLVDAGDADDLRLSRGDIAATALLVEGLIEEDVLLQNLAVYFDCPPAGYGDGLYVERPVFDGIDPELIRKYEVIPVRRRGTERVDVIVVEPLNDMAQQILEKQFDAPIRQYIWPRARYLQARHFFLGDKLPDSVRSYLREHPVSFGYATPDDELDVHQALRDSTSLHVHQWSRADVREFIEDCFDRDTLLKVLLGYAGHWLTNRLIVVFGKQGIQPYFVEEWPELSEHIDDLKQLREIHIDSEAGEPIRTIDSWTSGTSQQLELQELFDELEVASPKLLATFPVQLGGRNAMSLIGVPTDRTAAIRLDQMSEDFDLEPLAEATEWVGTQLEYIIKRAKKESLPPPADRIPTLPQPTIQVGLGFEDSLVEQEIAKRQQNQQRHRWEIVDISHVIEESSAADDESPSIADDEADSTEIDGTVDETDREQVDESKRVDDETKPPEQTSRSAPETNLGTGPSSSVVEVVADALGSDDSSSSAIDSPTNSSDPELVDEPKTPADKQPDHDTADAAATSYGMPTVGTEESSSGLVDGNNDSESIDSPKSEPISSEKPGGNRSVESTNSSDSGDIERPPSQTTDGLARGGSAVSDGWSNVLDEVSEQRKKEQDAVDTRSSDAVVDASTSRPGPDIDDHQDDSTTSASSVETNEQPSSEAVVEGSDATPPPAASSPDETPASDSNYETDGPHNQQQSTENDKESETADGEISTSEASADSDLDSPSGLSIPTGPSGVPMAQILRRPSSSKNDHGSSSKTKNQDHIDDADDDPGTNNNTGRTMMGLGEVSSLADDSTPDDSSQLQTHSTGGLAEAESRPGGTVQMNADSARTQTFGEFLDDMESEHLEQDPDDEFDDKPLTVPVEAIEEIDSGPMAVEIEESLSMIDSLEKDEAYAAAEHLATAGASVLPKLDPLFPGRLFTDRYQFSVETMPPVNEHGPILETLVRIGKPSLAIVDKYLDDKSLERRFYATFLLTELPAEPLLAKLSKRLFDRDQQTRSVARKIIYAHRHVDDFEHRVIVSLRDILEESEEDFRIEIAADNLRLFKDIAAVPLLIEHLQNHAEPVRDAVHRALREITFQSLAPSPSEWRRWWFDADGQPRWKWLVEAMNSDDKEMRLLAFDEIEQLPGLEIDFHPEQPPKLRARAQEELTEIFEGQTR